ncbi:MAG: hypothetical protein EBZ59_04650 [Planctomycetia bacterium]|nr:hypothetical protein [Planctomycetia bacterium]
MPIQVVCAGCRSRFSVSDQFAGRTGPCPKCKQPIVIPAAPPTDVRIHEPEPVAPAAAGRGRGPIAPIVRFEKPVSTIAIAATAVGAVGSMAFALLARLAWGPGHAPVWLVATAAVVAAIACVPIGYRMVRDRELEPYAGRSLVVRALICAAVYAALWGVRGFLPPDMTVEMWQWLFIAPIFGFAAALAALATLDLDWGQGVAHYSLYVLFTAVLRWLAGFTPV